MASLYTRARSPFYWISFLDHKTGKRRLESTKLRHDDPVQTRRARELLADFQAEEAERSGNAEAFDAWVIPYLRNRYGNRIYTLSRYLERWHTLSRYLDDHGIVYPRQLTRAHVHGYLAWRQSYGASKNTALGEIAILRLILFEAVQLGYIRVNPCSKLGIGKDSPKRKPRITPEEHEKILAALADCPDWMQVSYRIAWEQGCRLTETQVPLADIDLKRKVIGFRTKGKKEQIAEFPLSEGLVPLIASMKASGCQVTCKLPKGASKRWTMFFRHIGLSHLSFHCLRVTMITRCHEAGLSLEQCMRLVGHATVVAHSVYPRLTADSSQAQALRALV